MDTIRTIRNRILSRIVIRSVKLIWWWEDRKPVLQRSDSFTARALFFFGALVCVLSAISIQLHYAVFIATIGCIAGTTALLAASWLIIHHKED